MKILINHSNEDSMLWKEERKDFDVLLDVASPKNFSSLSNAISDYREIIWKLYFKTETDMLAKNISPAFYLYLGGNQAYCFIQYVWWKMDLKMPVATKILDEEGKFVDWRVI